MKSNPVIFFRVVFQLSKILGLILMKVDAEFLKMKEIAILDYEKVDTNWDMFRR